MTYTDPPCSRCGRPLPPQWVWVKKDGKFTGQAACMACAKPGEEPGQ
jgi:hypothetical protein